jgi:hypothetical protein
MSDAEIKIYQGDAIKLEMHIVDEEGKDFDLTDFESLQFMVKSNKSDINADALLSKTEADIVVVNATAGKLELQLKYDDTKGITIGRNWYELQLYDSGNDIEYTPLQGYFTVMEKVLDVG